MNAHVSLDLENTKLWLAFAKKADDKQRAMVKDVCHRAASLLDLIRDTFPTYTLHNRIHAINVINLMGELLNDRLENLSTLEGAILILSAYCHDIGMVFTDDERKNLESDSEFKRFLREHPEASVMLENSDDVSVDVAEWYCRWIHPDRVFKFFKNTGNNIKWGIIPMADKLGYVCRSHGYDSVELIDDDKYPIDYLGDADLKFCAVILRLADILDFDNSRSPEEVYKYLGIEKHETKRKENSDTEWGKHLASQGFTFIRTHENTILKLIASPNHPAVEYDVRQFLDIIEIEFQKCIGVLKHCSDRWRNFSLPISIDRNDIHSNGYKYGEYKFTLDQQKVPELLMGENLYSDSFVFVRELIQNAIDTTRHRSFYEKNKGNPNFTPKSIEIYSWLDEQGYQWVRVDDFGMGMTEEIIKNYFLKVGESYYQSSAFRASIIAARKPNSQDFVPISRFGIGVLSCFIACDRIEVSTRHAESNLGAIRLSLPGLHSFYILQSESDKHYNATLMPAPPNKSNFPYRENLDFGTSLAIRLDPRKEKGIFDLEKLLREYVLCSPISIIYDKEIIGGKFETITNLPWVDSILEYKLNNQELKRLERVFKLRLSDTVVVKIAPRNLSKHSPNSNLRGQALVGSLIFSSRDSKKINERKKLALEFANLQYVYEVPSRTRSGFNLSFTFHANAPRINAAFGFYNQELSDIEFKMKEKIKNIQLSRLAPNRKTKAATKINKELDQINQLKKYQHNECSIDLQRITQRVNPDGLYIIQDDEVGAFDGENIWMAHNGIRLPPSGNPDIFRIQGLGWIKAIISLQDSLRPEISLSRERVNYLTREVASAITFSLIASGTEYDDLFRLKLDINLPRDMVENDMSLGPILSDTYIRDDIWSGQKIIRTIKKSNQFELLSLDDIRNRVSERQVVTIIMPDNYGFMDICARTLIQTKLNVVFNMTKSKRKPNQFSLEESSDREFENQNRLIVSSEKVLNIHDGQKLFLPLFFVPYPRIDILLEGSYSSPLNQNHPFSNWLIMNSPTIKQKYPGIFSEIKDKLESMTNYFPFSNQVKDEIKSINDLIVRLQKLDQSLVTKDAFILEKDIVRNPSRRGL